MRKYENRNQRIRRRTTKSQSEMKSIPCKNFNKTDHKSSSCLDAHIFACGKMLILLLICWQRATNANLTRTHTCARTGESKRKDLSDI